MCYGAQIAAKAKTIATRTGMSYEDAYKLIEGEYSRWTSAFGRPEVPILMDGNHVALARWTFLGPWIKDEREAAAQTSKTGVCRSEEMFDKPTFKVAARERRCLLPFEAYYEHQHRGKVKVPYRFYRPTGDVFFVGGVWQQWNNELTFAVCTMAPGRLAAWIHNNPDAVNGPRQPVILRTHEEAMQWVHGGGPETVEHLIQVREDGFLVAEETENINGNRVEKAPAPPENMPEGIVLKGQQELW